MQWYVNAWYNDALLPREFQDKINHWQKPDDIVAQSQKVFFISAPSPQKSAKSLSWPTFLSVDSAQNNNLVYVFGYGTKVKKNLRLSHL